MSAPRFTNVVAVVAAKDLRHELRTLESLSSSVVFAITVLVLFNFAFGLDAARQFGSDRLVPGVLWLAIAFASLVTLTRSLHHERQHDALAAVFLAPVDRSAIFAGKVVANLVKVTLMQIATALVAALFFDAALITLAGLLLLVLVIHGYGLTVLGTLFAAVTSRLRRGEALLAVLLLPACAPLLISAVKCTAALLSAGNLAGSRHWLFAAIGFDLLYTVVGLATFELVLEE